MDMHQGIEMRWVSVLYLLAVESPVLVGSREAWLCLQACPNPELHTLEPDLRSRI